MKEIDGPIKLSMRRKGEVAFLFLLPADQAHPNEDDVPFASLDVSRMEHWGVPDAEVKEAFSILGQIVCCAATAKLCGVGMDAIRALDRRQPPPYPHEIN